MMNLLPRPDWKNSETSGVSEDLDEHEGEDDEMEHIDSASVSEDEIASIKKEIFILLNGEC